MHVLLFFLVMPLAARYRVDGVKAIIYSETETIVITDSEAERPGLDGQPKSLEDTIFTNRVYLNAKDYGWTLGSEDIDKNWEDVKKQNNLSESDMQRITEQSGYTIPEAKKELGKMSAVSQMFDFKVKSDIFVSKQEVQEYYHNNPEVRPAQYYISRGVVPFSDLEPKDAMKKRLELFAQTGKGTVRIAWSEPFCIEHGKLAADKEFIYAMQPGQISMPTEIYNGFELFKLVDKKPESLVPLSERYDEIASLLKRPKYEQILDDYKKDLATKTTVVVF